MHELVETTIRSELDPGEQTLWNGRPRQGFVLRAVDAFLIPLSLLWGGFAIFWEVQVIVSGASWWIATWGIPFILVGLYIIVGRFWLDTRQRAQTFYVVTPERIIIESGLFARRVKSLSIDTLTDVTLTQRGDGGTITFGPVPPFYWWYGGAGWPGFGPQIPPSFELGDQARKVYEIIRGAQRAAKRRS